MLPGLSKILSKPKYKKEDYSVDPFQNAESIEDKIRQIVLERRVESNQEDIRRARVYYKVDLFYRGYQNLGAWDDSAFAYPLIDDDPMDYSENRFRRNALILAGSLLRAEPTPVIRPGSDNPSDYEASIAANAAWDISQDNVDYENIVADKALYKVLFGNAFIYSDYQIDKRFGTIMVPKFKYDNVEIPGASVCSQCGTPAPEGTMLCPECGYPMEPIAPMQTETQIGDGFEERQQGQEFSVVCSPLEVKCRSKVKGGMRNQPYLLWITKEDVDAVRYVYPKLDVRPSTQARSSGNSGGDYENALRYQDILAALPGNIWGGGRQIWATTNYFDQCDTVRAWIRPQLYKGDKELEKAAPDGLMAVLIEGNVVEWRPEEMDDHWTHEVGIRSPHSFYGDGLMFDDVSVQRMINTINQLQVQHLQFDTIPLRLFDSDLVVETDITNDPGKKWIAVNTSAEKGLDRAVRDLPAQTLSMDVQAFKAQVYQADQDVTGATDPVAGKIAGANTPYSAQVLAVEQAQTRFLQAIKYNAGSVRDYVTQIIKIDAKNWIDPRTKGEIDQNIGKYTWTKLTGAEFRSGWTVKILTNDFKPKTRAEAMQGLEYLQSFGVDVMSSPKMRLDFFEKVGITPDGDMLSTQVRRAFRQIERMKKADVAPDPLIDDGLIQAPVIQEYLASQQGEQLMEENPQAFERTKLYMQTVLQMAAMRQAAMAGMGMPGLLGPQPEGQPPPQGQGGPPQQKGQPGGQPGQQGGGPKTEMAQSPANQKQPQPTLPQGVR